MNGGAELPANADLGSVIYAALHHLRLPVANPEGLLAALYQGLFDKPISKRAMEFIMGLLNNPTRCFQNILGHLIGRIAQQAGGPAERPPDRAALGKAVQLVSLFRRLQGHEQGSDVGL